MRLYGERLRQQSDVKLGKIRYRKKSKSKGLDTRCVATYTKIRDQQRFTIILEVAALHFESKKGYTIHARSSVAMRLKFDGNFHDHFAINLLLSQRISTRNLAIANRSRSASHNSPSGRIYDRRIIITHVSSSSSSASSVY